MKMKMILTLCGSLLLTAGLRAQVPQLINYQGRVAVGGTNFNGSGQFRFALVNSNGTATFWSNDGTSAGGSQPAAAVSLAVSSGLYAVLLGDATLAGMAVVPATVFTNVDVRLRVWFNDGVSGSQLLSPDQRLAAVGYAMMAGNIPDGLVTAAKIADGTITGAKLASGAVGSAALGSIIALGNSSNAVGQLDVYRTSANTPGVSLFGSTSTISTYGSDGLEQIRLWGGSYGELLLNNSLANNGNAVTLSANSASGGYLALKNTNGSNRAYLGGLNTGGSLTLYQADGNTGVSVLGDSGGAGYISVTGTNGSTRASLDGSDNGGGALRLKESDGTETVTLTSQGAGALALYQGDGSQGLGLFANNGTGGGGVTVYRDTGAFAGQLTVSGTSGYLGLANSSGINKLYALGSNPSGSQGGYLGLINSAGSQTITLDASDASGNGKITTQVLQITGGSDLSEQFDINAATGVLQPGLIVSIDPAHPGELALSREAFDKKVAGVISGAGGVKTGMLMGQAGTKADGKHAVALTGRVYCWVDADAGGAVTPGDLITTSATPGHGMKAGSDARASGALIGKAMSSLASGKGLVLVLVSLQ